MTKLLGLSLAWLSFIFQQLNFFPHKNPQEACVFDIKKNVRACLWSQDSLPASSSRTSTGAIKHAMLQWDCGQRDEHYARQQYHKRTAGIRFFIVSRRDIRFNRNGDVSDISLPMEHIVCQKKKKMLEYRSNLNSKHPEMTLNCMVISPDMLRIWKFYGFK